MMYFISHRALLFLDFPSAGGFTHNMHFLTLMYGEIDFENDCLSLTLIQISSGAY